MCIVFLGLSSLLLFDNDLLLVWTVGPCPRELGSGSLDHRTQCKLGLILDSRIAQILEGMRDGRFEHESWLRGGSGGHKKNVTCLSNALPDA